MIVETLFLAFASPEAANRLVSDAAKAVGCPLPDDADRSSALAATTAGEVVVATLAKSGEDDIGELCVGTARRTGHGLVRTASTSGRAIPVPDQVAGLSNGHVDVRNDGIGDVAGTPLIAVTTGGDYSSTATEVHWTTLHLFRRVGGVLDRVLEVELSDTDLDKNGMGGHGHAGRKVVAGPGRHLGASDLSLEDSRGRTLRRFRWNGRTYVAAR